jgi:hypothetical protein
VREEFVHLEDFDTASVIGQDHVDVPSKIAEYLPAGSAGRREAVLI